MHIATATVLHRVYTFDKTLTTTITSGIISALLMAFFIAWHCIHDELLMHSILFGVMIVIVGTKTRSLISTRISSHLVRKQVRKLVNWGSFFFITGFALWNLDQIFCGTLTGWKRGLGMPWSFVLELHGWWHVFTGLGAYIFIALVEYLTSEEAGRPLGRNFAWPVGRLVDCSVGEAKGGAKLDGNGNGSSNDRANGVAMSNGATNGAAKDNGKKTA
jgi:dihydroceramidase